jgi:hypothetical protein
MKTVIITKEIDCDELTCGKCEYKTKNTLQRSNGTYVLIVCKQFNINSPLKPTRDNDFMRCDECLAAEETANG